MTTPSNMEATESYLWPPIHFVWEGVVTQRNPCSKSEIGCIILLTVGVTVDYHYQVLHQLMTFIVMFTLNPYVQTQFIVHSYKGITTRAKCSGR